MAQLTLPFGTTEHSLPAHLYVLTNQHGMMVAVTDVGASLVQVRVPDAQGTLIDVALGWGGARYYEHNDGYLGTTVGRVANRVAGSSFELDGIDHTLEANEGSTSLHGGPRGWNGRLWSLLDVSERRVTFGLQSPAGDQGYPSAVSVQVSYRLSDENELTVFQSALPDGRTPISLTNHSYWNLNGHASGTMLEHTLSVDAERYLATNDASIPTGVEDVAGTVFDLREPTRLGTCLSALPRGIDHNYCLQTDGRIRHAARLASDQSGIVMDLSTDAPGLQVYLGGFLNGAVGKDGARYQQFAGVALEAQGWPDALHHDDWPSIIHEPGNPFARTTTFAFSTLDASSSDAS